MGIQNKGFLCFKKNNTYNCINNVGKLKSYIRKGGKQKLNSYIRYLHLIPY